MEFGWGFGHFYTLFVDAANRAEKYLSKAPVRVGLGWEILDSGVYSSTKLEILQVVCSISPHLSSTARVSFNASQSSSHF